VLVIFIQTGERDCVIFTNYDILLFVRKGVVYRGGVVYACEGKIVEGYFALLTGWGIFLFQKGGVCGYYFYRDSSCAITVNRKLCTMWFLTYLVLFYSIAYFFAGGFKRACDF